MQALKDFTSFCECIKVFMYSLSGDKVGLASAALKSDNLQYNTMCHWVDGMNVSLTKCLMFQALFFIIIACKILYKNPFNYFLIRFLRALYPSQQPTVLSLTSLQALLDHLFCNHFSRKL